MGETAIWDKFYEYGNININKENDDSFNKMEKYIKENINKNYNFKKFVFTIFIPCLILFISTIVNKIKI